MSIVKAFGCDCCGIIKPAESIVGITPTQDLFDNKRSYPTCYHAERAPVHYCLDCYSIHVIVPAENESPRGKDIHAHHETMSAFAYMFRKKVFNNWMEKKFFKKLQST